MDSAAEDVVRAFYAAWDTVGFAGAFEQYLASEAVWQNNHDPVA